MYRLFLILAATLAIVHEAVALDIECTSTHRESGKCTRALLHGEINYNDHLAVQKFIDDNKPYLDSFHLNSPGGDVIEATKIGVLVRKNFIFTEAPIYAPPTNRSAFISLNNDQYCPNYDCECSSACFFIWAAGIKQSGTHIGLHRPHFDPQYFRELSLQEAQLKYQRLLDQLRTYLANLGIPDSYYVRMTQVPSESVEYLSKNLDILEPNLDGFGDYIPAVQEWLKSNCGFMTEGESNDLGNLFVKQLSGKLSSQEKTINVY